MKKSNCTCVSYYLENKITNLGNKKYYILSLLYICQILSLTTKLHARHIRVNFKNMITFSGYSASSHFQIDLKSFPRSVFVFMNTSS